MYILSTIKIREFADAVLRLPVTMVTGELDPDQVKTLLGEILDVWPASIYPGLEEPDLSILDVEPDLSGLMEEPDLSSLDVELGDLPAVMEELDKL